jgi:hypothetical protein
MDVKKTVTVWVFSVLGLVYAAWTINDEYNKHYFNNQALANAVLLDVEAARGEQ